MLTSLVAAPKVQTNFSCGSIETWPKPAAARPKPAAARPKPEIERIRSAFLLPKLKQLFGPDRKVPYALFGGMEHGVGNGRIHADDADLADAFDAERIHPVILLRHDDDFNGWHIRVHGYEVVRQVVVD